MIRHAELGDIPFKRGRNLKILIDAYDIQFAGNSKLKIYGLLSCSSGTRMKMENRVFFKTIEEAKLAGYRPCGHCIPDEYKRWKEYSSPSSASPLEGAGGISLKIPL